MVAEEIEVLLDTLKKLRDELDSAIETLETLMDKNIIEGIKKAKEEFRRGDTITHEEIKKKYNL